ncbi:response regulator transcription factor [Paractinoplanes lichenicola]|uniref:Response regulator transcription factor n=1 Tax=Paractinoplanes lichenicola TaxID=2802976 RepID=A0ABS1VT29_9ACTN|nr:response regulator transcription factor [Actinoplanes lichenicola]MBL7257617.1 response regulator transcription factor [Actinoplanes lichenicola]
MTDATTPVVRILVAEDMPIIRKALVALLALEPDLEVVADVDRGDAIVPTALDVHPDVALLDIDLPGRSGIDAAEELHRRLPGCRIVILTGLGQPGHLLRALSAHVRGFVVKDAPVETLIDGLRRVAAGGRVVDPELVTAALETGASPLTAREADVLRAAGDGHSTGEIGRLLSLSPATVRNYLSNAIAKTGARNRIGAIRAARDAGWI